MNQRFTKYATVLKKKISLNFYDEYYGMAGAKDMSWEATWHEIES